MQIWLTRCHFGNAQLRLHDDYRNRYQTSKDEIEALKAIFEKFSQQAAAYQAEQDEIAAEKRRKEIESTVSPYWQNFNNNNLRF